MSNAALQEFECGTGQEMYTALSDFPGRYSHPSQSDMTGADILDISWRNERSGKTKYPLWSFFIGKSPLTAWLHKDGDFWFAEIDELNVISEGLTPRDAILDLEEHIRYFIDFYKTVNEDELAPYAIELRKKFSEVIPQY